MLGRVIRGVIIVLAFLVPLEIVSWWPSPVSGPCLIKPEQEAASGQNNQQQACAALTEGALILLSRADKFFEHHDKSILAVFTIVLAISTTLLWWSTDKLWRAGERQLELIAGSGAQQARDMQASIKVARDAAKAAARSADSAERSLIAADRAWLAIEVKFLGPLKLGPEFFSIEVQTTIKNIGRSPAVNLQFSTQFHTDMGAAAEWISKEIETVERSFVGAFGFGQVLVPGDEVYSENTYQIRREAFVATIRDINEFDFEGVTGLSREPITHDHPCVACFAWYGLPTVGPTGKFKYSSDTFMLTPTDKNHPGWDGTEVGEVPQSEIEPRRTILGGRAS